MVTRVTISELQESLKSLLETDRPEMALRTVQRFANDTQDQYAWIELRECLEVTLGVATLCNEPWVSLYARILRGCRDANSILGIGHKRNLPTNPMLQLERVWALIHTEANKQAQPLLEQIMPLLEGNALGLAYRLQATLRFGQQQDWQQSWRGVRQHMTGRPLGIALLDEANHHELSGNNLRCREVIIEAMPLFTTDTFHLAWALHTLGMSHLREMQFEAAEIALLEAERLTRKKRGRGFRARALSGIASLRRQQGDLKLAESQYRIAARIAGEPDDLLEALWGVGHCLRLQVQPVRALEQFERALRVNITSNWIHVHRALAHLMLQQTHQAETAIRQAGVVLGATRQRLMVAQAELARLEGNTELAREFLADLPVHGISAKEECLLFPALFALLEVTQQPQAAPVLKRHEIELRHCGILINGRLVPMQADSKVAQLLRLLLNTGELNTPTLAARLWPESLEDAARRKRKQVWRVVRDAQELLGWRSSIVLTDGGYQLDPEAKWSLGIPF
jgi:tetratricopeptide (TPR) repeat protein